MSPSTLSDQGITSKLKAKIIQDLIAERDKYITRNEPNDKKSDELVQIAAAGIGIVSKAIHHRRDRETQKHPKQDEVLVQKIQKNPQTSDATQLPAAGNDRTQVQEVHSGSSSVANDFVASFLSRHSTSTVIQSSIPLTTPIVIPQRRPKTRRRGFLHAYAPILSSFDIPQATFLDFISTLNKSLTPNPCLNANNLAGFAGEAAPEPFSLLIGFGVEIVTDMIIEAHSRMKSNEFVERVNEAFFQPRGLFVFIGCWNPSVDEQIEPKGVQQTSKNVAVGKVAGCETWRNKQEEIRRLLVPAGGNFADLSSAPLIFPATDKDIDSSPKKVNRFDRTGMWLDDYGDKDAQVKWRLEHPYHPMMTSLPKPEFRSRYADRSHAASNGDLVAFLAGGRWYSKPKEKKSAKESKGKKKEQDADDDDDNHNHKDDDRESGEGHTTIYDLHDVTKKADKNARDSNKRRQEEDGTKKGLSGLLEDVSYIAYTANVVSLTENTELSVFNRCTAPLIGGVACCCVNQR